MRLWFWKELARDWAGLGERKFICIQQLCHYRDDKQSVTAEVWHATKINMKYDNRVTACIQAHTSHPPSLRHNTMDKPTNQSPINEDGLGFNTDPTS